MAALDVILTWCKQKQISLRKEIELLESGKMQTGENHGSGWIDTTVDAVARAKNSLEEIDRLVSGLTRRTDKSS
jgi:hypothetical protein